MALTGLVRDLGNNAIKDVLHRLCDVSWDGGHIGRDGREVGRGGCCRAEEAEGEGSEDRESERAHGE
jgi:hypothetical protein